MWKYLILSFLALSCKVEKEEIIAPKVEEPSECKRHLHVLKFDDNSTIHWTSIKKGFVPVYGKHKMSGVIYSNTENSLIDSTAELKFDLTSLDTKNELRDHRILKYLFGYDTETSSDTLNLNFKTISINSLTDKYELPEVGNTTPLRVLGVLEFPYVGDKKIEILVNLTNEDGFYSLKESSNVVKFSMREDFGLGNQLDELMTLLSGVKIEDDLFFDFNIRLKDICKG